MTKLMGLKDKNGIEMQDGDIVLFTWSSYALDTCMSKCKIVYDTIEYKWWIELFEPDKNAISWNSGRGFSPAFTASEQYEVIGRSGELREGDLDKFMGRKE